MTTIPTVVIKPSTAAEAYTRNALGGPPAGGLGGFGDEITKALGEAVQIGHNADDQAMKAISGGGNLDRGGDRAFARGNDLANRDGHSRPQWCKRTRIS